MSNLWAKPLETPGSPKYQDDIHQFMMDECIRAYNNNLQVPLNRADEMSGLTNSRLAAFKKQPVNMSIAGLQGCTAIAVISEKGAWLAHIWEDPVMKSIGCLQRDVLDVIANGDPAIDPRNNEPYVHQLSTLVGPGQMFNAEFKPRILYLTPGDPNASGSESSSQSSKSSVAPHNIKSGIRYPFQIGRIDRDLRRIVQTPDESTIAGYDVYRFTIDFEITAKGKLLVQYTPAQTISPGGEQKAMIRVYAFDNPDDLMQFSYTAHPDQKL